MCVTFCYVKQILFWNHNSCTEEICSLAGQAQGPCQTCCHRRDEVCALTNAPLPAADGCCHWNATLIEGFVSVTPAMVAPLAGFFTRTRDVVAQYSHQENGDEWIIPLDHIEELESLGVEFGRSSAGLHVNPDRLILAVEEPVVDILEELDAPYLVDGNEVLVDPDELGLPTSRYGEGTEF